MQNCTRLAWIGNASQRGCLCNGSFMHCGMALLSSSWFFIAWTSQEPCRPMERILDSGPAACPSTESAFSSPTGNSPLDSTHSMLSHSLHCPQASSPTSFSTASSLSCSKEISITCSSPPSRSISSTSASSSASLRPTQLKGYTSTSWRRFMHGGTTNKRKKRPKS